MAKQTKVEPIVTRWVLVNGVDDINTDIAPHVVNELGGNGEEVEILFSSEAQAKEYAEQYMLDDLRPIEIVIQYK